MRHRTLIAGALGVALLASAYFVARRDGPVAGSTDRAEPSEDPVVRIPGNIAETPSPPDNSTGGTDRVAGEVRAMSQTFRNSTFLDAIRRAGYYCDDVVSASESAEGGWVASCADKGGYTLGVRAIDHFDVRPIGHYLDGIAPVVIERDVGER